MRSSLFASLKYCYVSTESCDLFHVGMSLKILLLEKLGLLCLQPLINILQSVAAVAQMNHLTMCDPSAWQCKFTQRISDTRLVSVILLGTSGTSTLLRGLQGCRGQFLKNKWLAENEVSCKKFVWWSKIRDLRNFGTFRHI